MAGLTTAAEVWVLFFCCCCCFFFVFVFFGGVLLKESGREGKNKTASGEGTKDRKDDRVNWESSVCGSQKLRVSEGDRSVYA